MDDRLSELIRPVVRALGCDLWGIEQLSLGRGSTLKVYIDSSRGVDVEDCAAVSRQLSSLLDVEDPVSGHYTLEVSSPGLDRRLFHPDQYGAFVGATLRVRLKRPFDGRRKFSGRLKGIEGDEVLLSRQEGEIRLPFEDIDRANVVPET